MTSSSTLRAYPPTSSSSNTISVMVPTPHIRASAIAEPGGDDRLPPAVLAGIDDVLVDHLPDLARGRLDGEVGRARVAASRRGGASHLSADDGSVGVPPSHRQGNGHWADAASTTISTSGWPWTSVTG